MNDVSNRVIALRLDVASWERYAAEASAAGLGLSTYLRRRLEQQDDLRAELLALRRTVEDFAALSPAAGGSELSGPLLETLLLCRTLAQAERTAMVQRELERVGLPVWRPLGSPR